MTKYNQFFKQQVIDFYFENHESLAKTYHHFSLSRTLVNRWIEQFKHAGVDALIIRRTKQKYSTEFKLMVVQAVLHNQFTGEEATLHFGLPNSSLVSQWLKAFEKQGINGLKPKPKGRPSMKPKYARMPPPPKTEEDRLRLRILELEAENALLKKLAEIEKERETRRKRLKL